MNTPIPTSTALELAQKWHDYCETMGGTPDGDDYLVTMIQQCIDKAAADGARRMQEQCVKSAEVGGYRSIALIIRQFNAETIGRGE